MWQPSDAMKAWHLAMQDQTEHEVGCSACLRYRTAACAEGLRLQQAARAAHEGWVNEQYGGRCVA